MPLIFRTLHPSFSTPYNAGDYKSNNHQHGGYWGPGFNSLKQPPNQEAASFVFMQRAICLAQWLI